MLKCSDIFTPNTIFMFDDTNPISYLCSVMNPADSSDNIEWLNPTLKEMFNNDSNGQAVAVEYLLNRQDRYLSPLFERLLDHFTEEHLPDANEQIVNILVNKFLRGWSKLADAVFAEYNPIDNYNMVENRKVDMEEHTVTDNSETVTNKYSGFNAGETMSPVSESETEGNIETTKTDSGSSANNELTRRGNIGVTTTQQMIESSYNLAKKNLLDRIYHDIDTILFIDYC